jgi:hypothetical protein
MRRWFVLLLIIPLILSACNFPTADTTPAPDLLATTVAKTLTAQPPATQPPTQPVPTQTQPAPVATATSQPSATSTVTVAATQSQEDPRNTLGSPAFRDTLETGKTFFTGGITSYEDAYTRISVENGAMILTSLTTSAWKGWRLAYLKPQDFYLEATFKTHTCSGADQYGLVFRAPDYDSGQGYNAGLTCDGRYFLRVWTKDTFNTLGDITNSDALLAGSNQTNRLGVWVKGDSIKIYINGVFQREYTDSTFKDGGVFGPFIAAVSTTGFTVEMEEIAYWNVP